ncbi:MAG TPA: hypothetical protein DC017_02515 [Candidatus Wallbacteria bacterium]|nr:hypothetical protein [Candidatus Wallbacteria bacterium]
MQRHEAFRCQVSFAARYKFVYHVFEIIGAILDLSVGVVIAGRGPRYAGYSSGVENRSGARNESVGE